MPSRTAALLMFLALASPSAAQSPAPASPSPAAPADDRARVVQAVGLARAGRDAEALPLFDAVLTSRPGSSKVRLLRAKVRYRLARWEDALDDAERVFREAPALPGARELLAKCRAKVGPKSVTVVGGAAKYSEWSWSWTIKGGETFALADYKGGEGHTLFYFPAKPGDAEETRALEDEASDQRLYFLRIVELKGADNAINLELPAAKAHKVGAVPYLILLDGQGNEAARGGMADVSKSLDALRKAAKAAQAKSTASSGEAVSRVDFGQSEEPLESLAQAGYTTVVMVTSPG